MDASFWEEVEQARRIPGGEKMSMGLRMYDEARARILADIKRYFPDIAEEAAESIRHEVVNRLRRF